MQHILSLVRRCVEDYDMIDAGETVAVGVSGGKDSVLTLAALARLRRFYPKPFEVAAVTIDAGTPGMDFSPIARLCRELEVPYYVEPVPIYEVVFQARQEKNPCSLCAKFRRGALSTKLNELGISKIALGHHYDDAVETMLMSLFIEGRDQLLPAGDLPGPHRGHPDPPPALRPGAGGAGRGEAPGPAGGGEPLPRQRLHQAGGDEGPAPGAGPAVPRGEEEDLRRHPALPPLRLEPGGAAALRTGGPPDPQESGGR